MKFVLLALVTLCGLLLGLWRCEAECEKRASSNVDALLDSMTRYTVRDSLNGVSISTLTLTLNEFKRHRAADAALIAELKLRLRRVNAVTTTGITFNNQFQIVASSPSIWARGDNYSDFTATIKGDTLTASIEIRDTIVQILHRVPRFKLLGIWFGTKAVRQEVISKNPNSRIAYASYIEIKKR